MSNPVKKQGRCLCGKVSLRANVVNTEVHACHCNMCQQWNGGPTLSAHCGTDVSFTNEGNISVYRSCDWAELGFCKTCGSHIFYRLVESGEYLIQTGTFESSQDFSLDQQLFIEEKPAFYDFANETQNLTGAEVFAQHESGDN